MCDPTCPCWDDWEEEDDYVPKRKRKPKKPSSASCHHSTPKPPQDPPPPLAPLPLYKKGTQMDCKALHLQNSFTSFRSISTSELYDVFIYFFRLYFLFSSFRNPHRFTMKCCVQTFYSFPHNLNWSS